MSAQMIAALRRRAAGLRRQADERDGAAAEREYWLAGELLALADEAEKP